ncbi:RNA dependent RNA polymerase-domain-containing protein [Flagelloscypha sp. PMI_526]|nr:RNA dependent RNA polymerase-domain-containing protein [Flagelloscypha sp. PMI_526]
MDPYIPVEPTVSSLQFGFSPETPRKKGIRPQNPGPISAASQGGPPLLEEDNGMWSSVDDWSHHDFKGIAELTYPPEPPISSQSCPVPALTGSQDPKSTGLPIRPPTHATTPYTPKKARPPLEYPSEKVLGRPSRLKKRPRVDSSDSMESQDSFLNPSYPPGVITPFYSSKASSMSSLSESRPSSPTIAPPAKARKLDHLPSSLETLIPPVSIDIPRSPSPLSSARDIPHISRPPVLGSLLDSPFSTQISSDSASIIASLSTITYSLPRREIAHSPITQYLLDEHQIAFGVQYLLALSTIQHKYTYENTVQTLLDTNLPSSCTTPSPWWDWRKVREMIPSLEGNHEEVMPKVLAAMFGKQSEGGQSEVRMLGRSLDWEEEAMREGKGNSLLLGAFRPKNATESEVEHWAGGSVQFVARLARDPRNQGKWFLALEPPESTRSNRLARMLGSRRIIHVKIPETFFNDDRVDTIKNWFTAKFILCGRVFVPLPAKDKGYYLVEVRDDTYRAKLDDLDELRMTYIEILNLLNPMSLNFKQPISKYVTRFGQYMSSTHAVIEFAPKNILFIDDLYSPGKNFSTAKTEEVLTDGCGFINRAALVIIQAVKKCDRPPSGVQGRIAGQKGLWILHPTDRSDDPKIWCRRSQNKINLQTIHRGHCILEIISVSVPPASKHVSYLGIQPILNFAHNGVPIEILINLFCRGLETEAKRFFEWDDLKFLWHVCDKAGGITAARLTKCLAEGKATANNWKRSEWNVKEREKMDEKELKARMMDGMAGDKGRKPHSKAPLSNFEKAFEFIQSGMKPHDNPELRKVLLRCAMKSMERNMQEVQIALPGGQTFALLVAPDPLGVLKEDEFQCQTEIIDDDDNSVFTYVTGDTLMGKYPVRVASDIIKLRGVRHPALADYKDIILVSVKGFLSIMSLISGGDYDGDLPFLVLHREIVQNFQPKPLVSVPPNLVENHFVREVESVTAFLERLVSESNAEKRAKMFFSTLLGGIGGPQVGLYSNFHEASVATLGYDDPESERLAFLFSTLLDAAKTGLRLKPGVFESDSKKFNRPACFKGEYDPYSKGFRKDFVLNRLLADGKARQDAVKMELELRCRDLDAQQRNTENDRDLIQPLLDAQRTTRDHHPKCPHLQQACNCGLVYRVVELSAITSHVDQCYEKWKHIYPGSSSSFRNNYEPQSFTPPSSKRVRAERMQDRQVEELAEQFAEPVQGLHLFASAADKIKVAYAWRQSRYAFAATMGHSLLCRIKAESLNSAIGITASFHNATSIGRPLAKSYNLRLQS